MIDLKELKKKLAGHKDHFQDEVGKLRTNRASAALVEDIVVDYYGSKTPLKQLATITIQKPATIIIDPWDKNGLSAIEKSLTQADLGAAPTVAEKIIRITLPPMDEERRKKLVDALKEKAEAAKIAARQDREDTIRAHKEKLDKKEISEDEFAHTRNEIQKELDAYNTEIDQSAEQKEQEIMTV